MNKFIALALAILLTLPIVFSEVYIKPSDIEFRQGGVSRLNQWFYDPRVQPTKMDMWMQLRPPSPPIFARGYPPYYPRGTAWIQSTRSAYKPIGAITIQTKDLRSSYNDNTYYEGWLYDVDTGYSLSLGKFQTVMGGVAEHKFRGSFYFNAYEYLLVTREPADDMDPRPSDDEVLIGTIRKPEYFEPTELGTQGLYGRSYVRR